MIPYSLGSVNSHNKRIGKDPGSYGSILHYVFHNCFSWAGTEYWLFWRWSASYHYRWDRVYSTKGKCCDSTRCCQGPGSKGDQSFPPSSLPLAICPEPCSISGELCISTCCVWICKSDLIIQTPYRFMADGILNSVSQSGFCGTLVLRVDKRRKLWPN